MSFPDADTCRTLDNRDPLRPWRDAFRLPDGVIYLNGNSLGPLPKAVPPRLEKTVLTDWSIGLTKSWNAAGWFGLPARVGGRIAPLIGAQPHEVIMADTVSANLFKLAAAACRLRPERHTILATEDDFPTDLYMMQGLTDFMAGDKRLVTVPRTGLAKAVDGDTALVVVSHVHYVSADIADMAAVTRAVQQKGALILWDLSHSAGAVPVDLTAAGADFAVGCGYKYLNGGPGAPAFVYAAERHHEAVHQPLTGWFGHARPFAFDARYEPAAGMTKLLTGTTGILGATALDAALDVFDRVDMALAREKSLALSRLFIDALDSDLSEYGFTLASPREGARRGGHVTVRHPHGYQIVQALIDHGVIGDFRAPDYMRFGFAPLYLGYSDVHQAVERISTIMNSGLWRAAHYGVRKTVT